MTLEETAQVLAYLGGAFPTTYRREPPEVIARTWHDGLSDMDARDVLAAARGYAKAGAAWPTIRAIRDGAYSASESRRCAAVVNAPQLPVHEDTDEDRAARAERLQKILAPLKAKFASLRDPLAPAQAAMREVTPDHGPHCTCERCYPRRVGGKDLRRSE